MSALNKHFWNQMLLVLFETVSSIFDYVLKLSNLEVLIYLIKCEILFLLNIFSRLMMCDGPWSIIMNRSSV